MEASKEDCAKQCYNTPGCEAWTYRTEAVPDYCWLKTSADCKAGMQVGSPDVPNFYCKLAHKLF